LVMEIEESCFLGWWSEFLNGNRSSFEST
jgi:hypothetical protein